MVAFIESRIWKFAKSKLLKLVNSMKADFLFASLNQNRTIQKNRCQNKAHFMDDVFSKTRGIIYLNVESWFLFAPPIKISGNVPGYGCGRWAKNVNQRKFFSTPTLLV